MRNLLFPRTRIHPLLASFGLAALLGATLAPLDHAWAQDKKSGQDDPQAPDAPRIPPPGVPGPRLPLSPLGGPGGPMSPAPKVPGAGNGDENGDSGRSATITSGDGATGAVTVKHVPCVPPNTKVTMDYVDTPLLDVTKYMAEITCKNFILGDKLDGQVTIISHQQVTVDEAYQAYLSALAVADYTTVTVGKNTKVVKAGDAAKTPLRTYEDENIPETDQYVTQIIHLDNVSVADIGSIVGQLGGEHVQSIAYPPTNTLIVTDSAFNIRRVYRIIKELDVAAPKASLVMIPLKYAAAADVQKILDDIFGVSSSTSTSTTASSGTNAATPSRRRRRDADAADTAAAPGPSSTTVGSEGAYIAKILADERTNSLIVQANDEAVTRIKDLVAKLDVDVDPYSKATIHVIQLNYAKAEDVASVLSNLTDSRSGGSTSSSSRSTSSSSRSNTGTNRSSSGSSRSSGSSGSSSGFRGTTGKPEESGGAGPDGLPGGAPVGPGGGFGGAQQGSGSTVAAFDNGMRITADENTNRLLVVAAPDDFKVIERVVKDLDIRRQQVYVEAVVVEVGSTDEEDWGVAYHGGAPGSDGALSILSGQMNANSVSLPITDTGTLLSGLAVGVFGKSLTIPVTIAGVTSDVTVPAFGIALNALASNSKVNILSNPNLLCVDNEEGTINVGRNIPFPVSSGRDNNNNPIVSYQREDVGITLKVTPQINEANYVTLETNIEVQEVEEDSSGLDVNTAGFITSKRETEQTVVARDNQTIVIGGLIGNTETQVETKIPVLGDLPLIGVLFRGKRTTSRKTNLLIFLTPHVINEPADLEEVYRVKMAQRDEFIKRFYGKSREAQQREFADLMQGSMNLVDEPSMYRLKAAPDATGTIEITREGSTTANPKPGTTESVPQPSADPSAAPASGGGN